jgi:two-component system response regulator AtoC
MKPARNGNKIMLVDDEPDIVVTFKAALESAGFTLDAYEDPIIALSKFKPSYYDLVILDIKMSEMNGFELYTEMLKIDEHVRACFITAGEMYYDKVRREKRDDEEQQYCKLDRDRFLQKPISNVDLINRIEKIMMLNKSLEIQNK